MFLGPYPRNEDLDDTVPAECVCVTCNHQLPACLAALPACPWSWCSISVVSVAGTTPGPGHTTGHFSCSSKLLFPAGCYKVTENASPSCFGFPLGWEKPSTGGKVLISILLAREFSLLGAKEKSQRVDVLHVILAATAIIACCRPVTSGTFNQGAECAATFNLLVSKTCGANVMQIGGSFESRVFLYKIYP